MSDGDIFREVEEEVRKEQYKKIWDQYGTYIIGAAVAIVAIVAGYQFWVQWSASKAATAGAQFEIADTLSNTGKTSEANKIFQSLIEGGPQGYQVLSKFRLAANSAADGQVDEAVKLYDELAKSGSVDKLLQDFAQIQAAMLLIDKADPNQIKSRIGQLSEGSGPWRFSAQEMKGLSAYRSGDKKLAEDYYSKLIGAPGVPLNIRQRAEMMLSLLIEEKPGSSKGQNDDTKSN